MRNIASAMRNIIKMINQKKLDIAYYTWALMTPWGGEFYK